MKITHLELLGFRMTWMEIESDQVSLAGFLLLMLFLLQFFMCFLVPINNWLDFILPSISRVVGHKSDHLRCRWWHCAEVKVGQGFTHPHFNLGFIHNHFNSSPYSHALYQAQLGGMPSPCHQWMGYRALCCSAPLSFLFRWLLSTTPVPQFYSSFCCLSKNTIFLSFSVFILKSFFLVFLSSLKEENGSCHEGSRWILGTIQL